MAEQSSSLLASSPFALETRADGIAVLWIDVPGQPLNTLQKDFDLDLARLCDQIEGDETIGGLIIASRKPGNFVAGADIGLFEVVQTAEQGEALSRGGQRAMDRIARLTKPTLAAIDGTCLGGGLELALACSFRVASTSPKTRLGVPEVKLGLLCGAGGTQRLPSVVGVQNALDLMLTGKQLSAKRALKIGLVDDIVPKDVLLDVAAQKLRQHLRQPAKSQATQANTSKLSGAARSVLSRAKTKGPQELIRAKSARLLAWASQDTSVGRRLLFDQVRKRALKQSGGHYPAIERTIAVVETGLSQGSEAGFVAEAKAFGELLVTPQARALISLFRAQTALKKDTGVADTTVQARPLRKIGVLGGGLMGSGIAIVTAAKAGLPVRLREKDDAGVLRGLRSVQRYADEQQKRRRWDAREGSRFVAKVSGTRTWSGFAKVDIVIEAVFEDLELKRAMLAEVESLGNTDAIFASNTSSLPIRDIAAAAKRPQQVVGMHYFSPVEKMPLLEVIVTDQTADWVTATCVQAGKAQGKTVIVVGDGPGFYTTRIVAPFMAEAARLLEQGVSVERIDSALVDFGFPVGPLKLIDEVGIDVGAKVCRIMHEAFPERMDIPAGLVKLVQEQRLGRKTGRGFYRYEGKKSQVDDSLYATLGIERSAKTIDADAIAERCVLRMVNEAVACLGEGILRSARDGDVGAVFGLGFPPFLGGPFRWVDERGVQATVDDLHKLAEREGRRFAPAPALVELGKAGGRFFEACHTEPRSAEHPRINGQPSSAWQA